MGSGEVQPKPPFKIDTPETSDGCCLRIPIFCAVRTLLQSHYGTKGLELSHIFDTPPRDNRFALGLH